MNTVKERLQKGEKVLGMMLKLVDEIDIAQIIKLSGFDLFIADNEHGFFSYKKLKDLMLYAKAIGICPMIRIPEISRDAVLKSIDLGAVGLMAPDVRTKEEAQRFVQYAKYAPMGDRGINPVAAHSMYAPGNMEEYMRRANEETILIAMIESQEGLENAAEILEIDGIDAILVGKEDFSQSSGYYAQYQGECFQRDVQKAIDAAKAVGKAAGIGFGPDELIKWMDNGIQIGLLGNEITYMLRAAKEDVGKVRHYLKEA